MNSKLLTPLTPPTSQPLTFPCLLRFNAPNPDSTEIVLATSVGGGVVIASNYPNRTVGYTYRDSASPWQAHVDGGSWARIEQPIDIRFTP